MPLLSTFFKSINYTFKNKELIKNALLHASFIKVKLDYIINERYEFLGDRVLNLVIAENLLITYPNAVEGQLAKRHAHLVSSQMIAKVMTQINLKAYIRHNLENNHIPERVVSNIGEAFIAALYLDAGLEGAKTVILNLWKPYIESVFSETSDPKSQLQEFAQRVFSKVPVYTIVKTCGTDHQPLFQVNVTVGTTLSADGHGTSKKAAERDAALKLLTEIIPNER